VHDGPKKEETVTKATKNCLLQPGNDNQRPNDSLKHEQSQIIGKYFLTSDVKHATRHQVTKVNHEEY